jgi:hypothetical protein
LIIRPGYIAGVTNPIFESRPKWWDVLCNISTGKITVSSEIEFPKGIQTDAEMEASKNSERDKDWMRVGYWEGDNDLIVDVRIMFMVYYFFFWFNLMFRYFHLFKTTWENIMFDKKCMITFAGLLM